MSVSQTVRGVAFDNNTQLRDQLSQVGFGLLSSSDWHQTVAEADETHWLERASKLADASEIDWAFCRHQIWVMTFVGDFFSLIYYPLFQFVVVCCPVIAFQYAVRPWIRKRRREMFRQMLSHGYYPTPGQIDRFHSVSERLEVLEQLNLWDGRVMVVIGEETPTHEITKINFCLIDHLISS